MAERKELLASRKELSSKYAEAKKQRADHQASSLNLFAEMKQLRKEIAVLTGKINAIKAAK